MCTSAIYGDVIQWALCEIHPWTGIEDHFIILSFGCDDGGKGVLFVALNEPSNLCNRRGALMMDTGRRKALNGMGTEYELGIPEGGWWG